MKKNKLLAASILTLASGAALAGAMGEPCPEYLFRTGPYIGIGMGPIMNAYGLPSVYGGYEGVLFAGYGHLFNNFWYLGGEIFGTDNAKIKDNPNLGSVYNAAPVNSTSASSTWSWGGDFLPGVMINDHVLGYGRVGGVQQRFNNSGVNRSGWQVGVGGQTQLWNNIDIRLDYIFSYFNRVTVYNANGNGQQVFSTRPVSNQVNASVLYKFDEIGLFGRMPWWS